MNLEELKETKEFSQILFYYGTRKTKRSQVPLMNHIIEGCELIQLWNGTLDQMRAYCLHPLVGKEYIGYSPVAYLAEEMDKYINKYSIKHPIFDDIDEVELAKILTRMHPSCALILLADKVQNQKDFRKYHYFTHDDRYKLERMFNIWINTLRNYYI